PVAQSLTIGGEQGGGGGGGRSSSHPGGAQPGASSPPGGGTEAGGWAKALRAPARLSSSPASSHGHRAVMDDTSSTYAVRTVRRVVPLGRVAGRGAVSAASAGMLKRSAVPNWRLKRKAPARPEVTGRQGMSRRGASRER